MGLEKSNSEDHFTKMYKSGISCIIPAAGLSSRMGCWKGELFTRDGITFIENAVATALKVCPKVIVVAGSQTDKLREILKEYGDLIIVENREYQTGMLGSIQRGLELVNEDFFIFPMDMPLIREDVFNRILNFRSEDRVIRPEYAHIPGHPVFFPRIWRDRILAMKGQNLGGQIHSEDLNFISWDDDAVVTDIDSMDEYNLYINSGLSPD